VLDSELPAELIDRPIEQVASWRFRGEPTDTRQRAWVSV
jgi:hypothetical protein